MPRPDSRSAYTQGLGCGDIDPRRTGLQGRELGHQPRDAKQPKEPGHIEATGQQRHLRPNARQTPQEKLAGSQIAFDMTERQFGRLLTTLGGQKKDTTPKELNLKSRNPKPATKQFYTKVLDDAEKLDFETAAGADGIDDEITLLRVKIKTILRKKTRII